MSDDVASLFDAVEKAELSRITLLLMRLEWPMTDVWFEDLIVRSVEKNQWDVACSLLRVILPAMPADSMSALVNATRFCSIRVVEAILHTDVDVSVVHASSRWPLGQTAKRLDDEMTALLLKHGASVNCLGLDGTKLDYLVALVCMQEPNSASGRRRQANIVRLLLEHGGSPHTPMPVVENARRMGDGYSGGDGLYPIQWACINGNAEVVRSLLQHGADPNITVLTSADHDFSANPVEHLNAPIDLVWNNVYIKLSASRDFGQILRMFHERGVGVGFDGRSQERIDATFERGNSLAYLAERNVDGFFQFVAECSHALDSTLVSVSLMQFPPRTRAQIEHTTSGTRLRVYRTLLSMGADVRVAQFGSGLLSASFYCLLAHRCCEELRCWLAWGHRADDLYLHGALIEDEEKWEELQELRWLVKRQTSFLLALRCARKVLQCARQFSLIDSYVLAIIVGEVWRAEHPLLRAETVSLEELRWRHGSGTEVLEVPLEYQWMLYWKDFVNVLMFCDENNGFIKSENYLSKMIET